MENTIDPELPLNLVLGRPKVLQLAKVPKRIYVPDDQIVRTGGDRRAERQGDCGHGFAAWVDDVDPVVRGRRAPTGQSTVSYLVRVFADPILARPIESLEQELNQKFPNSFIELDQIEDRMIVRGQTPDSIEMSQILQVLAGARGVNAGLIRPQEPVVAANPVTLAGAFSFQETIDPLAVEEAAAQRRRVIDPIALAQAGIINQMKVVGEQQVMLKVTVAEVNRSAARSIGLNFAVDDNDGFTVFQSLVGNLVQPGGNGQSGATFSPRSTWDRSGSRSRHYADSTSREHSPNPI